jgi:hypothetical protein
LCKAWIDAVGVIEMSLDSRAESVMPFSVVNRGLTVVPGQ